MLHSNKQPSPQAEIHAHFLLILPKIELHATIYFRGLRCPHQKADAIAEVSALAWRWYVRLIERGKDPRNFVSALASFAARAVRSGRRVCGQEKAKDVLSSQAQQRHGFQVESLPTETVRPHEQLYASGRGQHHLDAFEERLHDNTITPPPDQAAFRIDFPTWLTTRTERDRQIIDSMAQNHRTKDLARRFGISPARVSQLRREYHDDWTRFCDDHPNDAPELPTETA